MERIHARLQEGESEIFLKINKDREKITVVGVRDAEGALIGYREQFVTLVEVQAIPTA